MERKSQATKYPGIYLLTRPGKADRFMVSFRIRGVGQRTKTLLTLREARAFQATARDPEKARRLKVLYSDTATLEKYFMVFLSRRRRLAPSTRLRYEGIGRNYLVPSRLGPLRVVDVTRDDVEAWVSDLEAAGVGASTIQKAHSVLRAVMSQACREGKCFSNPASSVELPAESKRDPFFLTPGQVEAIAREVPARHRALVYTLAYTGIRMGEASALRVKSIDFLGKTMLVAESSAEVGGKKIMGETKTRRKRVINLPEALVKELARHVDQFVGPASDSPIADPDAWLFTHGQGGQIRQNNWRARVFRPACARAEVTRQSVKGQLETPRPHDLRHTAASIAASAGYSLHEVKEMLGHQNIKMTSDLYLHLFKETQQLQAQALGEVMEHSARTHESPRLLQIAESSKTSA